MVLDTFTGTWETGLNIGSVPVSLLLFYRKPGSDVAEQEQAKEKHVGSPKPGHKKLQNQPGEDEICKMKPTTATFAISVQILRWSFGGVFSCFSAAYLSSTMVRAALVTVSSLALTGAVVAHAYLLKQQFYPTVVYLTKSSPSMAVLYIQAFVLVFLLGKFMRKVFFGQLRAAEMEHLIERSWYAVTETCLMERSPNISWLFHMRVLSLMSLLAVLDFLFVNHACHSIITRGASVQLVFGFEYAILLTMVLTTFIKYVLHTVDLQSENPWDNKAVYMLYTELFTGFIKVLLYIAFMTIMIKVHTFLCSPSDHVPVHERQQTCPTCRMDVLRASNPQPALHLPPLHLPLLHLPPPLHLPTTTVPALPSPHPLSLPSSSSLSPSPLPHRLFNLLSLSSQVPAPLFVTDWFSSCFCCCCRCCSRLISPRVSFSFPPPFPSAPWLPMPPPPPFVSSMPPAPPSLSSLSDQELQDLEAEGRRGLEARLQCLQNIHTLLDAAMLNIHHYLSTVATLTARVNGALTSSLVPMVPLKMSGSAQCESEPAGGPAAVSQPADSTSAPESESRDRSGDADQEEDGEPNAAELRRRRLRKLETSASSSSTAAANED
ncbi:hypothetical protein WMY93_008754 [Mugilogobius chulae]|uniref:E3 ubiquitin-protein ligase synoviolin-like TPR repeats domain-containing protein n=1 Tax=Mugilogobius chulae TaxID=88201 RepID=A0AAW0PEW7_9GOBI